MNLFIIGDVHGCLHTFAEVLNRWQPATDHLVQVGDLVDRGRFAPETVELARQLHEQRPDTTTFLCGNHEAGLLRHYGPAGPYPDWLSWGGRTTTSQYRLHARLLQPHLAWLAQRPLVWENDHLLVSHAGLSDSPHALEPAHPDGLLWRRGPLKNIGKLQVVGHTPTTDGQPYFDPAALALYLDTGAYLGKALTGVRFSPTGEMLDIITVPTDSRDIVT